MVLELAAQLKNEFEILESEKQQLEKSEKDLTEKAERAKVEQEKLAVQIR